MITTFNQRQLNMMLERISWYEKGELSLGKLVNSLEALFYAIEHKDSQFERRFYSDWVPLEIIYSCMICDKPTTLDEEDTQDINDAVKNLKELIQSYLNKFSQEEA